MRQGITMSKDKKYDVVFWSNGEPKEVPVRNVPYAIARSWIKTNLRQYSNGLLKVMAPGLF